MGAVGGALLTIPLLDPTKVDPSLGWRLACGLGAIRALGVLIVRGMCERIRAGCSSMAESARVIESSRRSTYRCAPRTANCPSHAGGVIEAIFGVKAERQTLENLATPLTAADVDTETESRARSTA